MKLASILLLVLVVGCSSKNDEHSPRQSLEDLAKKSEQQAAVPSQEVDSDSALLQARSGFKTMLLHPPGNHTPPPEPPAAIFKRIKYSAPSGQLWAYLSPDPRDGKKHPAIVWITGGDCNSIDELWLPAPRENDQTAAAFRNAGIVMMSASLRGGNDNPGIKESFLGEVDDILAATDHLAQQPYVDTDRIYLGGHSTGGTLALLVAECSSRFRAVFSFGAVGDVSGYGPEYLPFNTLNPREVKLRSPGYWLDSIKSPVYVIEGTAPTSNIRSLRGMARISRNPQVHFLEVQGVNHFSILAPATEIIAKKIVKGAEPFSLNTEDFDGLSAQ